MAKNEQGIMLNKLRAAVLGANDGIVSTAGLLFGMAGATDSKLAILTAGMAGLVAGALSMGVGEYISVSSQRDAERAYIELERKELATNPVGEQEELVEMYEAKGISRATAQKVAQELTDNDPLKAHLEVEFGLDETTLVNPWHAGVASLSAFSCGALIPLLSVLVAPSGLRIPMTFVAVIMALTLTGYYSATVGGASRRRAIARVVAGGILAMVITYAVGHIFGVAIS